MMWQESKCIVQIREFNVRNSASWKSLFIRVENLKYFSLEGLNMRLRVAHGRSVDDPPKF